MEVFLFGILAIEFFLYFANIEELGPLPESEIRRIDFFDNMPSELTYPAIQPILFAEVLNNIKDKVQKSK